MRKLPVFVSVLCLAVLLSGCTASRPPGYNLPSADSIVAGDTYTVGRNENVYAIAQKNGVKLREILALNEDLRPPYILKPGQTITLPAKDRTIAPTPKSAPIEYIDKGHMGPPSNGKGGAAGIVTVQEESLPPLPTPTSPSKTNFTSTPKAAPVASETNTIDISRPLPPAQDTPSQPSIGASQPAPTTAPPKDVLEKPNPSASTEKKGDYVPAFGWPVRGTIISSFGPKGKGLDNDGINISAPKGSPVKAAESGIVAYAGNEMKGFGNLVLIRHEGGWVTAYAHLERLVVAKDSVVAKGDMIGTVGTTGGVSSAQLHFETRQEGKPVDPELMIK